MELADTPAQRNAANTEQEIMERQSDSPGRAARHAHRPRRQSDVEYRASSTPRASRSPPKRGIRDTDVRPLPSPRARRDESHDPMDSLPLPRGSGDINRKKSLTRPERRRRDRDDPNYYYRKHARHMEVRSAHPGDDPVLPDNQDDDPPTLRSEALGLEPTSTPWIPSEQPDPFDGSSKKPQKKLTRQDTKALEVEAKKRQKEIEAARVPTLWGTYCHLITFWCPNFVLQCFGKVQKAQQRAWREKMGLLSIIALICLFVGFLTFGFTAVVCPSGGPTRLRVNQVGAGYLILHGSAYDLTHSKHPYARGIPDGANVLFDLGYPLGGFDASFMFQNVNGHCKGLINPAENSDVPTDGKGNLGWYFPCNPYKQDGSSSPNETIPFYLGYACHLSTAARNSYYDLHASSDVYYTWGDIKNSTRNLAVWGSDVLDLDLIDWFYKSQVTYPARFDQIRDNAAVRGVDITLPFSSSEDKQIAKCFSEILKVGSIDTATIGCIASKVVLYVALAFILSIVLAKFLLALAFQWFLCKKYAASKGVPNTKKKNEDVEDWSNDIYRPPPKFEDPYGGVLSERSARTSAFLPTKSRFTSPYAAASAMKKGRPQPTTMASQSSTTRLVPGGAPFGMSDPQTSRESRTSLLMSDKSDNRQSTAMADLEGPGPAGFIHEAVVPQPPPDWQPFGYPLAHAICLVTAYSEGPEGLRTTLDSVATTDYPNSHKIILVVCDGMIKGHGEEFTTPEAVLSMMKDHTILPDEVQPFSYVAVASGSKRHNMAKIYSGFYDYGEESRLPVDRQKRVPMMVVVKTGTPDEANKAKPGNRGKRDSQIILMSFLQKVMFDERMTELEYEMFNGIWKITGISPDFYEMVLMIDADTKAFPDSLTHMVSAMVKDPEVMGLCGETKIANKRTSWVTMIQVFEYFISHHQAKSFESVFGGVTCLPGCFSMYRIKAPKGGQNYWVPILANPDIVEHYSENVVDTLHKKNLLLLGEDRYLSTLMLKTFPKRKQIFVPQAVCKTTVPDQFKILLSQRRRWINSTIHNLMELVLVRDLCGTFCFSMQFVVFIELIGTLVLPAAISFTIYLIIDAIVASIRHTPIPTIPLVLLALILGSPGILIVMTAQRASYIVWMLIYLMSLPVWNGILPAYSYWKFDDFSWGDTRKTAGEKTKKAGLEYEGEFDGSKILMRKWGEFEMERRLKGPSSAYGHHGRYGSASGEGTSRPGSSGWAPPSRHAYKRSQSGLDGMAGGYTGY
ncbi:MAG: Chitin synthase, class 3 [Chrysothrix sp. TS-e1954]|nr:MAG: Chitin synthase, class 3 [Chrysothrix sp. TS-e1954]